MVKQQDEFLLAIVHRNGLSASVSYGQSQKVIGTYILPVFVTCFLRCSPMIIPTTQDTNQSTDVTRYHSKMHTLLPIKHSKLATLWFNAQAVHSAKSNWSDHLADYQYTDTKSKGGIVRLSLNKGAVHRCY